MRLWPTLSTLLKPRRKILHGLRHSTVALPEGGAWQIATGIVGNQPATERDLGPKRGEIMLGAGERVVTVHVDDMIGLIFHPGE